MMHLTQEQQKQQILQQQMQQHAMQKQLMLQKIKNSLEIPVSSQQSNIHQTLQHPSEFNHSESFQSESVPLSLQQHQELQNELRQVQHRISLFKQQIYQNQQQQSFMQSQSQALTSQYQQQVSGLQKAMQQKIMHQQSTSQLSSAQIAQMQQQIQLSTQHQIQQLTQTVQQQQAQYNRQLVVLSQQMQGLNQQMTQLQAYHDKLQSQIGLETLVSPPSGVWLQSPTFQTGTPFSPSAIDKRDGRSSDETRTAQTVASEDEEHLFSDRSSASQRSHRLVKKSRKWSDDTESSDDATHSSVSYSSPPVSPSAPHTPVSPVSPTQQHTPLVLPPELMATPDSHSANTSSTATSPNTSAHLYSHHSTTPTHSSTSLKHSNASPSHKHSKDTASTSTQHAQAVQHHSTHLETQKQRRKTEPSIKPVKSKHKTGKTDLHDWLELPSSTAHSNIQKKVQSKSNVSSEHSSFLSNEEDDDRIFENKRGRDSRKKGTPKRGRSKNYKKKVGKDDKEECSSEDSNEDDEYDAAEDDNAAEEADYSSETDEGKSTEIRLNPYLLGADEGSHKLEGRKEEAACEWKRINRRYTEDREMLLEFSNKSDKKQRKKKKKKKRAVSRKNGEADDLAESSVFSSIYSTMTTARSDTLASKRLPATPLRQSVQLPASPSVRKNSQRSVSEMRSPVLPFSVSQSVSLPASSSAKRSASVSKKYQLPSLSPFADERKEVHKISREKDDIGDKHEKRLRAKTSLGSYSSTMTQETIQSPTNSSKSKKTGNVALRSIASPTHHNSARSDSICTSNADERHCEASVVYVKRESALQEMKAAEQNMRSLKKKGQKTQEEEQKQLNTGHMHRQKTAEMNEHKEDKELALSLKDQQAHLSACSKEFEERKKSGDRTEERQRIAKQQEHPKRIKKEESQALKSENEHLHLQKEKEQTINLRENQHKRDEIKRLSAEAQERLQLRKKGN
eukprot:MONOS_13005.1-p1 / transcript=MONOS_13005.1 / gene=MONOS_13005 / organism=Monocercomonoides_exilis_PA203 / gene_product=unspecified product / transcript_product=unspecified product / location=Mono_scaffold00765:21491-24614(+) / protein_length=961 / sequence_SO=supercontig / SO=protein_coding / is_pseudo=false